MTAYSNEDIVDTFLDHLRHLRIAHHVPGRIRVKASLSAAQHLAKVDMQEAEALVQRIPGIEGYRANPGALSVIIQYDQHLLPFSLWEEIGGLHDNPLARDTVRARLLAILMTN